MTNEEELLNALAWAKKDAETQHAVIANLRTTLNNALQERDMAKANYVNAMAELDRCRKILAEIRWSITDLWHQPRWPREGVSDARKYDALTWIIEQLTRDVVSPGAVLRFHNPHKTDETFRYNLELEGAPAVCNWCGRSWLEQTGGSWGFMHGPMGFNGIWTCPSCFLERYPDPEEKGDK